MAASFQIKLPPAEATRLAMRVADDYRADIIDHQLRMEKCRRYYQAFRRRVDPPAPGDEDKSNFRVPLTQWQVFTEWAEQVAALLGDDAEIVGKPIGPDDQSNAAKISRYMTWRMFTSMNITSNLAMFIFRKILFGKSFAYRPWVVKSFDVLENGQIERKVYYEGPDFVPLWPDDLICPSEDVQNIQEFSHVIRRYRATPDQLLRGDGTLYQGIRENFDQIVNAGRTQQREVIGEEVKAENDLDDGVLYTHSQSAGDSLVVHEWHGRWRPLLKGKKDGDLYDFKARSMYEQDFVVRTLPELGDMLIGCQDLVSLYPKMQNRRPFSEASSYKIGTYWPPGLGEMMDDIEAEVSANHNLFADAQQLSVWPLIFFSPSSGWDPKAQKYGPGMAIPSEHPEKVQVVPVRADLQGCVVKEQATLAYAERVSGNSDGQMGRSSDRPNAPRTATGQLALIQQGNIRADLDMRFLREDVAAIARDVWQLDQQFCEEKVFFRVTGEDVEGLFDTVRGGAYMTPDEFGSAYDFDIEFATNVWSREAEKQKALELYQIDMQNPLIVNDPTALWLAANRIHKAFGDDEFASIVPQPPDTDRPKNPKEEWSKMLQGEEIHPNVQDNDDFHLQDHQRRLIDYVQSKGKSASYDQGAVNLMIAHVQEHKHQRASKMMQQMMVQQLIRSVSPQQQQASAGGIDLSAILGQQAGQPQPQPDGGLSGAEIQQ